MADDVLPKQETQPVEVGTNITRIGVALVELSPVNELGPQNSRKFACADGSNNLINALGVETPAETLKL